MFKRLPQEKTADKYFLYIAAHSVTQEVTVGVTQNVVRSFVRQPPGLMIAQGGTMPELVCYLFNGIKIPDSCGLRLIH